MIEAQIGKDGKIRDMQVISSPGPLLTAIVSEERLANGNTSRIC